METAKRSAVELSSTWPYQQAANCSGESFFCIVRELHVNRDDSLIECQPLLHSFPAKIVSSQVSVYYRASLPISIT